ncbi:MAG: helix-turn-helix transcriptional regulator [Cellvibrionaceae bacterium]|nr:helix-turn-helix transcriptional regulator [Cellvibrionaceae bacterium]
MNISHLILNSYIAQALDIIGDRWSLLILREAFYGRSRFEEFIQHTGASRATLSRRLEALIDNNILQKRPQKPGASRFIYCFTERGIALAGPSLLAQQWDSKRPAAQRQRPKPKLRHSSCGHRLKPQAVCRCCGQVLEYDDVRWTVGKDQLEQQLQELRSIHQQRRVRDSGQVKADADDLIYLIGDRWTLLILILSFFGSCRYDDFSKQLNIAPSILAGRLKTMVSGGIMKRRRYQQHPPRYEYQLTNKGKSIFPFIMALRQWALERLPSDSAAPTLLHKPCGQLLEVDVVCGHCQQVPAAAEIELRGY